MLKRKIEKTLISWKTTKDRKPLIIKGIRQCGKTSSVLQFASANYRHVVYINFLESPEYKAFFEGSLKIDTITMLMSSVLPEEVSFVPGETVIILDEIQECPDARTSLKFFKLDGRYDVIATGSLLGVHGYREEPRSIPVGYETVIAMFPMDFEEFLWANGVGNDVIITLVESLKQESPIPSALHNRLRELLLQYTVVGGMPEVVQDFVTNKQMNHVLSLQRSIINSYKDDIVKYATSEDTSKILECFQSIPRQLSKDNKKFQYSTVKQGARSRSYISSLQWIEDAGIITRCYNLNITELPLEGNTIQDIFKVYMADTGLFISMLEDGTQFDILNGNLHAYKGAIFENLVADILHKMGRKLYYFQKASGMELDFIIRWRGSATPVEVKATSGYAKSLKTILNHPDKYHINQGIKLGDYNIGRNDKILTLPLYMAFLLTKI